MVGGFYCADASVGGAIASLRVVLNWLSVTRETVLQVATNLPTGRFPRLPNTEGTFLIVSVNFDSKAAIKGKWVIYSDWNDGV